jgi:hypothetical protein
MTHNFSSVLKLKLAYGILQTPNHTATAGTTHYHPRQPVVHIREVEYFALPGYFSPWAHEIAMGVKQLVPAQRHKWQFE